MMRNPWLDLPLEPQYVLPDDAPHLARHRRGLKLDKLPYPYAGNPGLARVCLLSLTPGLQPEDAERQRIPRYAEQSRQALEFISEWPFISLDPAFSATGVSSTGASAFGSSSSEWGRKGSVAT
jgi:hypothetical protein